jgi:hypothetical protein
MAVRFSEPGWYIARVETGLGQQYAPIELASVDPFVASLIHKELVWGPEPTAEDAWANWRKSLPVSHPFAAA